MPGRAGKRTPPHALPDSAPPRGANTCAPTPCASHGPDATAPVDEPSGAGLAKSSPWMYRSSAFSKDNARVWEGGVWAGRAGYAIDSARGRPRNTLPRSGGRQSPLEAKRISPPSRGRRVRRNRAQGQCHRRKRIPLSAP